jgi:hypothetical protein
MIFLRRCAELCPRCYLAVDMDQPNRWPKNRVMLGVDGADIGRQSCLPLVSLWW